MAKTTDTDSAREALSRAEADLAANAVSRDKLKEAAVDLTQQIDELRGILNGMEKLSGMSEGEINALVKAGVITGTVKRQKTEQE